MASRGRGRRHARSSARPPADRRRPGGRARGVAEPGPVTFRRGVTPAVPVERRVVGENGPVQALQRLAGIDPELTGEQIADTAVAGQRLGLPTAAVQRQHKLAVQPLPQRMSSGQPLQLGCQGVVLAKSQVSLDPGLQGAEP